MILHKEDKVTIIRSVEDNYITVYKNEDDRDSYRPLTQQLICGCTLNLSESGILTVTGNIVRHECFTDSFKHKTPELFTEDSLKKDGKTVKPGWATLKEKKPFKLITTLFSIVHDTVD